MQFLGCLFVFFFGIIILIIRAVMNIYHAAFGPSQKGRSSQSSANAGSNYSRNGQGGNSRQRRRKMFEDNEGEYVDFVEVKE